MAKASAKTKPKKSVETLIHDESMRDFFGVDGDLDLSELRDQARAIRAFFYDSIDDTPRAATA